MLEALRRPLLMPQLFAGVAVAAVAVALYCIAYTSLAGRPETLAESLAWAVANVCPWLIAIEVGKRASGWRHVMGTLAAALIAFIEVRQADHGMKVYASAEDAYVDRNGTPRPDLLAKPLVEWARRVTAR